MESTGNRSTNSELRCIDPHRRGKYFKSRLSPAKNTNDRPLFIHDDKSECLPVGTFVLLNRYESKKCESRRSSEHLLVRITGFETIDYH